MKTRSIADILGTFRHLQSLPAPPYMDSNADRRIGLAVESMKRHTSDEGWQIFAGLEHAGYKLCGKGLPVDTTDIKKLMIAIRPGTMVVQDKREWDVKPGDFRDPEARFSNIERLKAYNNVFKVTILKDAHHRPEYHRGSAEEMGVHAWIIYYNPAIVTHLAPYLRPQHLIRTYHSLDSSLVPPHRFPCWESREDRCLLSGAVSSAYPLRARLFHKHSLIPGCTVMKHPGYHRDGTCTPSFLRELTNYKVAICTSSIYGYTLRKIIEATACGCIVITDLPLDEVLLEIDSNLIRVSPDIPTEEVGGIVKDLYDSYDYARQRTLAERAQVYYDYRAVGLRLARDIEQLRLNYP